MQLPQALFKFNFYLYFALENFPNITIIIKVLLCSEKVFKYYANSFQYIPSLLQSVWEQ